MRNRHLNPKAQPNGLRSLFEVRMLRVALFLILVSLNACSSVNSELSISQELRERDEKSNQAISDWMGEKSIPFLTDITLIFQEIILLKNHPGWGDMEKVLRALASIQYVEGENIANQKKTIMIADWSRRWNSPGDQVFNKYRDLLGRCLQLENRRQN